MALLALHASAACAMAAVLWYVQLVHYPRFAAIPPADFPAYQAANIRRTACLVAPLMAVEAAAALTLAWRDGAAAWTGLSALALAWASTILVQLPLHRALTRGFDPVLLERLLRTNWLRTAAWSARAALAVWMLR